MVIKIAILRDRLKLIPGQKSGELQSDRGIKVRIANQGRESKMFKKKKIIRIVLLLCSLLLIMPAIPAFGADSSQVADNGTVGSSLELTLDDVVSRALANSSDLKLSDYDIQTNTRTNQDAADQVDFIPTGGGTNEAVSNFDSLVQSNITLELSKKTRDVRSDTLAKTALQDYTNVLAAKEKVVVAEKALAYSDYQRLAARVGYQVGTVGLQDKNLAEDDYSAKESSLAQSRSSLDDNYRKLDDLIGVDNQERPVLKDDPSFVPLQIDNLDAEVQRRMDNNPDIWQAYSNLDLAQTQLDTWNGSSSYISKQNGVNKAVVTASSTEDQIRQSLYSTYNSINQLEKQYDSLVKSLKQSQDNLKISQLKYDLGMIPKGDVLKAELDVANAESSLKSSTYQHEVLKISFDKPWTA